MQALISMAGSAAALVLCAVSAAMNYLFLSSLGKTPLEGQVLGAASAAADVLKALLPFFIAWSWQARRYVAAIAGSLTFAFLAAFSLLSAIGFAADNRGALVEGRKEIASTFERMQERLRATEARRATLPAHRPADMVDDVIARHQQSRRWSATSACTKATEPESRSYCETYFDLRAELAASREAAKLSGLIDTLERELGALSARGAARDVDPQVSMLSRLSGLDEEPVRLALIVAVALLVETGASLGLFLASGHGASELVPARPSATRPEEEQPQLPAPEPLPLGSVEDFCLEGLVPAKDGTLADQSLACAYAAWCGRAGRTALQAEAFLQEFAAIAAEIGLARGETGWSGIAVKHDNAASDMVS